MKRKCDECPEWYEVEEKLVQYDRFKFCSVDCFHKYIKRWSAEQSGDLQSNA